VAIGGSQLFSENGPDFLRCEEDEKADLIADAAAVGLPVSLYIRAVLIDYKELREWAEVRMKMHPTDD
jgi:hypothetical protein